MLEFRTMLWELNEGDYFFVSNTKYRLLRLEVDGACRVTNVVVHNLDTHEVSDMYHRTVISR